MDMRKLCLFVLLALLLTACGKPSPAAVTTEPEQKMTGVISETTAPLQTDSSDNGIPWNDPSLIGGSTWQEAYLSVIKKYAAVMCILRGGKPSFTKYTLVRNDRLF